MSVSAARRRASAAPGPPQVGLFGKLGSGNIGNDASMEAVLSYLRSDHPDAIIDAMCTGPERITSQYGIAAVRMFWYQKYEQRAGALAIPLKILGKGADAVRIASWVARHDVVIVPGMGVLETSLPLGPLEFPYALFLLGASGRLLRTKVALVSVGAGTINHRLIRWLFDAAARFAFYRSYRDVTAREAMHRRGVDVASDRVYPDLAFALPGPPAEVGDAGDPRTVGVGVMAYYGSNDDRDRAEEIHAGYIEGMKRFVRWLVDDGRKVRLLLGDTNGSDNVAVQEILDDLKGCRPGLAVGQVVAEPVSTFADIARAIEPCGSVVAIRFHNVLCALKLGKPTVAVCYSAKHDALMADTGMSEFCVSAKALDVDQLIKLFTEMEHQAVLIRQMLLQCSKANARLLGDQFAVLSGLLFGERAG